MFVEAALANYDDVDISSTMYGYDTSGNETLIPDHVLSVYGTVTVAGATMLEVRNPWGDFDGDHTDGNTGKSYDPTFDALRWARCSPTAIGSNSTTPARPRPCRIPRRWRIT